MEKDKFTYTNGELTVLWQPKLCAHSTICWKELLEVFNPKKSPWVNMEGATSERIAEQVHQCPSGALSLVEKEKTEVPPATDNETPTPFIIECRPNGPYLVKGPVLIRKPDGTEELRQGNTSLCRCGQSSNKPFCDGTHKKLGFIG